MIDIKSNIDHLDELAAQYLADDLTETGKDIRAAASDLKNLRDYAVQLERNIDTAFDDLAGLFGHRFYCSLNAGKVFNHYFIGCCTQRGDG